MEAEIQQYFDKKKELHSILLTYLENIETNKVYFDDLISFIQVNNIHKTHEELEHFLKLLLNIANNHSIYYDIFPKIEEILLYLKNDIKQNFSNQELFKIFIFNKKLYYFLVDNEIIVNDDFIEEYVMKTDDPTLISYCHFFFPEKENDISSETFEQKCRIGENDSYLCKLIREDSIVEFVQCLNQNDLKFDSLINQSLFETNSFLLENKPTLIEYAAFLAPSKFLFI